MLVSNMKGAVRSFCFQRFTFLLAKFRENEPNHEGCEHLAGKWTKDNAWYSLAVRAFILRNIIVGGMSIRVLKVALVWMRHALASSLQHKTSGCVFL